MGQAKNTRAANGIAVLVAVICMLFPKGVTLQTFEMSANGVQHEVLTNCSFFDTTMFSVGNWYPFVTAVLTAMLCVCVGIGYWVEHKGLDWAACILSASALVLSFSPIIFYEKEHYTRVGMLISYLLVCSLIMSVQQLTGRYFQHYDSEENE